MEGQQQAAVAAYECDGHGQQHDAAHAVAPEPCGDGRQHHQAHGHERAERLEAGHQVEHDQHQEQHVPERATRAHGLQENGIDDLHQQRPVDKRQYHQRDAGHAGHQRERGHVHRQHRTEQQVQQIDLAALPADHEHANGQAGEVEGSEVGVFLEAGVAAGQADAQRHHQPGNQSAQTHGGDVEAGQHVAGRHAGQHRVADGVAHQAHAAQHQQHADGRGAEREEQHAGQGTAHEVEFEERADQQIVQQAGVNHGGDGHAAWERVVRAAHRTIRRRALPGGSRRPGAGSRG